MLLSTQLVETCEPLNSRYQVHQVWYIASRGPLACLVARCLALLLLCLIRIPRGLLAYKETWESSMNPDGGAGHTGT